MKKAIRQKLEEIAEKLKESVIDGMADEIAKSRLHKIAASTAYKEAKNQLANSWRTFEGKMSVIGGKSALVEMNKWWQETFKISFTNVRLATEVRENEMDTEVRELLTAIEFNELL